VEPTSLYVKPASRSCSAFRLDRTRSFTDSIVSRDQDTCAHRHDRTSLAAACPCVSSPSGSHDRQLCVIVRGADSGGEVSQASSRSHGLPHRRHTRTLLVVTLAAATALVVTSNAAAQSDTPVATGSASGNWPASDLAGHDRGSARLAVEASHENVEPTPPPLDQKRFRPPHPFGIPQIEPPSPGPLPIPEVAPVPPGPIQIPEAEPPVAGATYLPSPDARAKGSD
jgi:hypothetical protein